MQVSEKDIIVIIVTITVILLVAGLFIVLYISLYNNRKKRHLLEKAGMMETYNKQLLQARLEMQEETFDTISREIHDNVGQLLSLAKLQLNIADQHDVVDKTLLQEIKENIGQAMTDLRDIAKSLSSDRLHQVSLPQAVEHELQRIERGGILKCEIHISGKEITIYEQHKVILFRIIQECLQNVLKHAKAKELRVDFQFTENHVNITIQDDGTGFDRMQAPKYGLGLQNIITRATLIGGTATIDSSINQGSTVKLNIPYV